MTIEGTRNARSGSVLVLAVGVSACALIALGLGRFAYALLLPAMREDLAWTYGMAGTLNSASAVGYLAGALTTTVVATRWGVARIVVASSLVVVLTVGLSGADTSWTVLMALRFVGGMTGAWGYLGGAQLISAAADREKAPQTMVGLYYGGIGLGISVSGAVAPLVLSHAGWRAAWWVLGMVGLGVALPMVLAVRRIEEPSMNSDRHRRGPTSSRILVLLAPTMLGYLLFGLGYVAYMTFAVAVLRDSGTGSSLAGPMWVSLGLGAFCASFVWPRLLDVLSANHTLALLLVLQAGGAAILAAAESAPAVVSSSLLFGACLASVPGAVTMIVREVLPAESFLGALSVLTVVFSVGQIAGPTFFGGLADEIGLRQSVLTSAVVLLAGGITAALQRGRPQHHRLIRRSSGARSP